MYAAFGDPAARAMAEKKKQEARNGEMEEKVVTPYSIFDRDELEEKTVRSAPCRS